MSSEEEDLSKVEQLKPNTRSVNLLVKVVSKSEPRTVSGGMHKVADILVGDETGAIYLTLWDDSIDKVDEGTILKIKNGYVSLFRGSMRLNVGRYGRFEVLEEEKDIEVNTDNNLSLVQYQQERRETGFGRGRPGPRRFEDRRRPRR
ncbi:MAG: OB-fold nucleic acid binding domain-containing protein [Candidatus Methanomethylicia archaeon]